MATRAAGCASVRCDLRPDRELDAVRIDEVKAPSAGELVMLGERAASRDDRAFARLEIVVQPNAAP